jgi:hypothetical protein
MEESHDPRQEDEGQQSLAEVEPTPLDALTLLARRLAKAMVLIGAAGAGVVAVGALFLPAIGATRSAKLKWQQRELEIERAAADAQANVDD